jgi:NADH-quinone oxidoreductase subunit F
MTQINSPAELEEARHEILSRRGPEMPCISICAGAGCMAFGAGEVIAAFKAEIEKQGLQADVDTKGTGCPGFCERGPVVVIYPEEIVYSMLTQPQAKKQPMNPTSPFIKIKNGTSSAVT